MKILIIGHSMVVDANRKIWDELSALDDAEVDLIVPKSWRSNLIPKLNYSFNELTDSNIDNIYPINCFFKGNATFFFFNPIQFFKKLFVKKYDVIFIHQETWAFSLLQLVLFRLFTKNRKSKLFIFICQNIAKKRLYFLRFFERIITRSATAIVGCCRETMDVVRWKGIKNRCKYFPFSFDDVPYRDNPINFQKDQITLGYLGRISEEKGIDKLLKAFQDLKVTHPNLKLVIGGGGPLVPLIKNVDGVEFLGAIPHNEAFNFYKKIDIFVLPSETRKFWKEQFGRVIVETVASSKIIVGSSSGAIPEVMGYLKMPYVFKEGLVEDLIAKIDDAISDIKSGKADQLLVESRAICFNKFGHKAVAKRAYEYFHNPSCEDEFMGGEC